MELLLRRHGSRKVIARARIGGGKNGMKPLADSSVNGNTTLEAAFALRRYGHQVGVNMLNLSDAEIFYHFSACFILKDLKGSMFLMFHTKRSIWRGKSSPRPILEETQVNRVKPIIVDPADFLQIYH